MSRRVCYNFIHNAFNGLRLYSARPAVGQYNSDTDSYIYLTFDELFESVKAFGSGLKRLLLNKKCNNSMISMCSIARLEWYLTDLACLFLGVPTVSLVASLVSLEKTVSTGYC